MKKTLVAMSIVLFISAGTGRRRRSRSPLSRITGRCARISASSSSRRSTPRRPRSWKASSTSFPRTSWPIRSTWPRRAPTWARPTRPSRPWKKAIGAASSMGPGISAPSCGPRSRRSPRFDAFWKENEARIAEAQSRAVLKIEVVTPAGYDPARTYPLFIALHGGGESIAELKPLWTSPRLRVRVHHRLRPVDPSGQHEGLPLAGRRLDPAGPRGGLSEDPRGNIPSTPAGSIIGGFSSGGFGALRGRLPEHFPVRGFVALCPAVPEAVRDEDV